MIFNNNLIKNLFTENAANINDDKKIKNNTKIITINLNKQFKN